MHAPATQHVNHCTRQLFPGGGDGGGLNTTGGGLGSAGGGLGSGVACFLALAAQTLALVRASLAVVWAPARPSHFPTLAVVGRGADCCSQVAAVVAFL